jgi:hypothetical protein
MFPTNLTTNEVKNAAGTEEEFLRLSVTGRELIFAKSGESPSLQHRLSVRHQETGSGFRLRRRSAVRVDKTIISTVDNITPVVFSAYTVVDFPVGAVAAITEGTNVLANLLAISATTGAGTTVLFDCSGYGAAALIGGSL